MKKKIINILVPGLVGLILLGSCQKKQDNPNAFNMDKDTSYAIGMYLASQWQIPDVHYDYQSFMEGFRAYNESLETKFSMDTAIMKIQAAFEELSAREEAASGVDSEANLEEGRLFLAENGRRPGVTTTGSGLQYEVITEGTGIRPSYNDVVRVHYEGSLIDGTIFDSSYEWGEPVEFPLDAVIPGWTEGVQLMSEGSIYKLYIPSDLGYGSRTTGSIPANSALIFIVELLAVIR